MRPSARAGLRFCTRHSALGRRPSMVLRTSFCKKLSRFGRKLSRFSLPFCFEDDLGCLQAVFGASPRWGRVCPQAAFVCAQHQARSLTRPIGAKLYWPTAEGRPSKGSKSAKFIAAAKVQSGLSVSRLPSCRKVQSRPKVSKSTFGLNVKFHICTLRPLGDHSGSQTHWGLGLPTG